LSSTISSRRPAGALGRLSSSGGTYLRPPSLSTGEPARLRRDQIEFRRPRLDDCEPAIPPSRRSWKRPDYHILPGLYP
jgi:hypothetical protein